MGLDNIKAFTEQLISHVEKLVNGEESDFNNKKLDSHEQSIFTQELNKYVQSGKITEEDAAAVMKEAMGLELSGTASAQGRRKAAAEGGDGGTDIGGVINEFIEIPVNINLPITINNEIKVDITNNLSGGDGPGGANIEELIKLLNKIIEQGGTLQQFLVQVLRDFQNDVNLNMGNMAAVLEAILTKLTELGDKVDEQTAVISKMSEYITAQLEKSFQKLSAIGLNVSALLEEVKKGNADNFELLGKIYTVAMQLSTNFSSFTEVQEQQFNQVMALLQSGNANLEQVLALLNLIKNDTGDIKDNTTEANVISGKILEAVINGNKDLLAALVKIDKDFNSYGDEVKVMLADIIAHIDNINPGPGPNPVDLTALLDKLDKILVKLDNIDDNTSQTAQNTAEIKETNKKILKFVEKYGPEFIAKFDKLIELGEKNNEYQEKIHDLIQKIIDNGVDLNIDPESLGQIIAAINAQTLTLDGDLDSIYGMLGAISSKVSVITGGDDGEKGYIQIISETLIEILNNMGGENPISGKDYSDILNQILAALGKDGAVNKSLMALITALGKKAENGDDSSGILGMLEAILAAIKDHKVLITIKDEKGNIIFESPHEGSQNNNILGVREWAEAWSIGGSGSADDPDAIGNVKADEAKGKKFVKDGKIFIKGDDGHIYDALGRLIQ